MNEPCNICGGSGKVPVWRHGFKTKELRVCKTCSGKGWGAETVGNSQTLDMHDRTRIPNLDDYEGSSNG